MKPHEKDASDPSAISERKRLTHGMAIDVRFHTGHYSVCRGIEQILCKTGPMFVPHSPHQAALILELDGLQSEMWDFNIHTWAEYLDTNPEDYLHCGPRLVERRSEAFAQCERMVVLGLLSKDQADYYAAKWYGPGSLQRFSADPIVHELLDINPAQLELLQAGQKATAVYTEQQKKVWERLTAKRAVPSSPDWPVLPDARKSPESLTDYSQVFRSIRDRLHLVPVQQRMLAKLEPIVEQGLSWITEHRTEGPFLSDDPRNDVNDPALQVRQKFLEHSERVALLGVLTPAQTNIATSR